MFIKFTIKAEIQAISAREEALCQLTVVLKAETKIAVEYSLRIFRYFPKIRFIVLVCSKS